MSTCTTKEEAGVSRIVSSLPLGSSLGQGPVWIRRLSEAVQTMSSCLTETWQLYEPCIITASYCKEGKPVQQFCAESGKSFPCETCTVSQLYLKTSAQARKDWLDPGAEPYGSQVTSKQYLKKEPSFVFSEYSSNFLPPSFLNVSRGSCCYCLLKWSTIPIKLWNNWKVTS